MTVKITVDPKFKQLNEDPSYRIKVGGVGREVEIIVNIDILNDEIYKTGGIPIDLSTTGVNLTQAYLLQVIQGHKGFFTEFVPAVNNSAGSGKLKFYGNDNSIGVGSAGTKASTMFTLASVQAGDHVTINGLRYVAVTGDKRDNGEFEIDGTDTAAAADLVLSINGDIRTGTDEPTLHVSATNTAGVITVTCTTVGELGENITVTTNATTRITIGNSTLTGGADQAGSVSKLRELDNNQTTIQGLVLKCAVRGV